MQSHGSCGSARPGEAWPGGRGLDWLVGARLGMADSDESGRESSVPARLGTADLERRHVLWDGNARPGLARIGGHGP